MEEEMAIDTHGEIEFSVELLKKYFELLFPSKGMYDWLTYYQPEMKDTEGKPKSDYFYRREFSFTLEGGIYVRYNCFKNEEEFKQTLIEKSPEKIDIGAVFNMPPKNHSSVESRAFIPQEKELVFDIDMTDYDDVRTCCEGANVCLKCWRFMSIATKIIDKVMREDFGYKHLLWVFSGRRGVHCWVCDPSTRKLTNEARSAIANYLTVHVGNEMGSTTAKIDFVAHPAISRAKDIIKEEFTDIMMRGQNILSKEEQRKKLIEMLPEEDVRNHLKTNWDRYTDYEDQENSVKLWNIFTEIAGDKGGKLRKSYRTDYVTSAMITFLYPRIDANVSKGINHLLKSPFCVHPKTGKICVPFDPSKVDEFDPCNCPTLLNAMNEYDAMASKGEDPIESFKTVPSLRESFGVFSKFLRGLKKEYTEVIAKEKKLLKSQVDSMDVGSAF
ncbi:unnamed protein product [Moneuplotes crassus]|uniref:DNA primase n=2 Tax=Euplotes crassus TaxID=5936 RepID=A0AAD1URW2_EUPCR|nr:unnamed protein product [Moneuplotes crassus]